MNRLLLPSASVTKGSALAASCGELLAAGGVERTHAERSLNAESDTTRLDCGYRVPHLAR